MLITLKTIEHKIQLCYRKWKGKDIDKILPLPVSGSARKYFRINEPGKNILAVFNDNMKENDAFVGFSAHFLKLGFRVPEVYLYFPEVKIYFLEDLGDITLFSFITETREKGESESVIIDMYKEIISRLVKIQIDGNTGLDYDLCYPRKAFDRQSVMWDLNYFKYYFIRLAGIEFHEQELENDFNRFADFLGEAGTGYFLYRDFQSRNIMLHNGELYFIDYQGGRKGALQYDLASLLYDSKADLSVENRQVLLEDYLDKASKAIDIKRNHFLKYYYPFVFIRLMQAMGAYGYRGYYEKKQHFLASIPYAVENLGYLLKNHLPEIHLPELYRVLHEIAGSQKLAGFKSGKTDNLKVMIYSFSYKNGIPDDFSGHGGGFVFDCRFLPNPGREEKFRGFTGLDSEVIAFLEACSEVSTFLENVEKIVMDAVSNYKLRNFSNLMISFGCTGGQHRSVYFADKLAVFIHEKSNVNVDLIHRELGIHQKLRS